MHLIIFIASLSLSINAIAAGICSPKGVDVCIKARSISDEMALTLPMQLNKNLSVHKVLASQNVVSLTALLAYDKATLDTALEERNISQEKMKSILINTFKSACISNPDVKAFINQGGALQYVYKFNDGSTYFIADLKTC